ncbi:unnamed protein product [Closterium sp. Naga37s-1]|nr:unnamed protein product [Closterium sp. Naga37s-1]
MNQPLSLTHPSLLHPFLIALSCCADLLVHVGGGGSSRGHMAWECTAGVTCSICGQTGHLQRNCRNVSCHKCGRKGHISKFCSDPFARAAEAERMERQQAIMSARAAQTQRHVARRSVIHASPHMPGKGMTTAWDGLGRSVPHTPPVLILKSPPAAKVAAKGATAAPSGPSSSPALPASRSGDAAGAAGSAGGGGVSAAAVGDKRKVDELEDGAGGGLKGLLAYGSDDSDGGQGLPIMDVKQNIMYQVR